MSQKLPLKLPRCKTNNHSTKNFPFHVGRVLAFQTSELQTLCPALHPAWSDHTCCHGLLSQHQHSVASTILLLLGSGPEARAEQQVETQACMCCLHGTDLASHRHMHSAGPALQIPPAVGEPSSWAEAVRGQAIEPLPVLAQPAKKARLCALTNRHHFSILLRPLQEKEMMFHSER